MWTRRHRSSGFDRGEARAVLLAVMVALTATAATVALVVILVTGSSGHGSSAGSGDLTERAARSSTAAPRTTPASSAPATSAPATSAPAASSAPPSSPAPPSSSGSMAHRPAPPLTYVVKRGDNLTVIARWFHLHGYGNLYERNRAVIGHNPNLIFPGQRITVSGTGMTVGGD